MSNFVANRQVPSKELLCQISYILSVYFAVRSSAPSILLVTVMKQKLKQITGLLG